MSGLVNEDRAPFLPGPPISRGWRAHAKDFNRRPLFVKQLVILATFIIIALPLWHFTFRDDVSQYSAALDNDEAVVLAPPGHSHAATKTEVPGVSSLIGHAPATQTHPAVDAHPLEHLQDSHDDGPAPDSDVLEDAPSRAAPHELAKPPETVAFALIMWSEDSASEGAILLKVRLLLTTRVKG